MGKGDTHTKKHTKSRFVKYELEIAKKDEGEFYAKVVGVLNGNRIKVIDSNGIEYQVGIRGNFYFGTKKENLNFTDIERHEYWVLIQQGISKNQYFLKHIYNIFLILILCFIKNSFKIFISIFLFLNIKINYLFQTCVSIFAIPFISPKCFK